MSRVARRAKPWVAVGFNLRKRGPTDGTALEGPHGVLDLRAQNTMTYSAGGAGK
jgi:hypothetical protein